MYLEYYNADGLRFDATTQINGNYLKLTMARLREDFPDKYFLAEHLPDNPWIINEGRFCATWVSRSHLECQRALNGQDPLNKVKSFLGWDGYDHGWNLVKYTLGSHDDVGDEDGGDAQNGLTNWDAAHRYLVDKLGGRANWWARAKCRLAWASMWQCRERRCCSWGRSATWPLPTSPGATGTTDRTATVTTDSTGTRLATQPEWRCGGWSPRATPSAGTIRRCGPTA